MYRRFSSLRERRCPQCGVLMESRGVTPKVRAEFCPECEGAWFDHGELKELLSGRITERFGKHSLETASPTDMACPDCAEPLLRRDLFLKSGVMINQCRRCSGSFVDNGNRARLKILAIALAAQRPPAGGAAGSA